MTIFTEMQELRKTVIAPYTKPDMDVMEIGAFSRPTFLPEDIGRFFVADYYTTEELKEQVEQGGGDPSEVCDVDYVLRDQTLTDAVGEQTFDMIAAHHVLEHLVDPFRWMKDMEQHLNEDGLLFISLPDKKFSFDRFRQDTSLPHFIHDFLVGGEHSLSEHCIDAALFYDYEYSGGSNADFKRFNKSFVDSVMDSYHPGMHVHVFQMETFADYILKPFLALGHLNYTFVTLAQNTKYGEFSFVLKKGEPKLAEDDSEFHVNAYDAIDK